MTVEVSKVTAYAVIRPAKNEVTASKVTVYAVLGPPAGGGGTGVSLSMSLMLR